MTFLLFVCHELLGPSAYGSCWHCPWCDADADCKKASFSVLPPKGNYKIWFKCHRPGCPQKFGDAWDLLRLKYPADPDTQRMVMVELRKRYMQQYPRRTHVGESKKPSGSSRMADAKKRPSIFRPRGQSKEPPCQSA
jgi:hypothetical protein